MTKNNIVMKVRISEEMAEQIQEAAQRSDVGTGSFVRRALQFYLCDIPASIAGRETDEVLEPVQKVLVRAVKQSNTWDELRKQIAKANLELAPKGGGLCVRKKDTKAEICKA